MSSFPVESGTTATVVTHTLDSGCYSVFFDIRFISLKVRL